MQMSKEQKQKMVNCLKLEIDEIKDDCLCFRIVDFFEEMMLMPLTGEFKTKEK